MVPAADSGHHVDSDRSDNDRVSVALLTGDFADAAAAGSIVAGVLSRGKPRRDHQFAAVCAGGRVPAAPGGRLGRCDPAHALQAIHQPPKASGMADGIAGGADHGGRFAARDMAQDVAGDGALHRARSADRCSGHDRRSYELRRTVPIRNGNTAVGAGLARESEHCIRAEQPRYSRRDPSHRGGATGFAAVCQTALDVLREVRQRGDALACAR